jgi:predicted metal-dependent RNase
MENKNTLRVRFLGAIGTVTGSCSLLEYYCSEENKKRYFLIDAGSYINENPSHDIERKNVLKYYAKKIESIFITHAHLDHIGILPDIIRYGFKGRVCCTQATHKLILTMLTHGEGNEQNEIILKKVSFIDIDGRHDDKENIGFGKTYIPITNNLRYGYLRSSHVLGSCIIYFIWTEKNYSKETDEKEKEWKYVYFTGDIGPVSDTVKPNILFKGYQTPYWDKYDKCIIMESTYGKIVRQKDNMFENKIKKLSEIIDSTISRGGKVIIPSFALDRAQQILIDLYYIFKDTQNDGALTMDNDNSWKTIFTNINIAIKELKRPSKMEKKLESLKGDNTEIKIKRDKIINEISELIRKDNINPNLKFSDISDKEKNKIAEIFTTYIPNPSSIDKIKFSNNQANFTFYSFLIGKINGIYKDHLTDEAYSNKDRKRKFKYLSNKFLEYFTKNKNEITAQKDEIDEVLSSFFYKIDRETSVKVSASGMCDEGEIISLLEKFLPDERATIILTGYQAVGTNGFLLKNLKNKKYEEADAKEKIQLKLRKKDFRLADVKCNIEDMSDYYSGHADQEQLIDYITPDDRNTGNITVLLNHGTDDARDTLKTLIEGKNPKIKVILPKFNEWLNFASFEYEADDINFDKKLDIKYSFVKVADIHIYYPTEYDNEKIQQIINYINELENDH